jgi:hypothetical protein
MAGQIQEQSQQDTAPEIVLRFPGPWMSEMELGQAIENSGTGYFLDVSEADEKTWLLHEASGRRYRLRAAPLDDEIAELFAEAPRVPRKDVEEIRNHKVKIFISGAGGSLDAAREFLAIGAAMVKSGALGVMVDNSGNCHSRQDWLDLAGDEELGGMYWAFVSVAAAREEVFSAGMHCLGFRDAEMPDPVDRKTGGMMMHEFLGYTYRSGVTVVDGDPIGGPEKPEFILHHAPCTRFSPETAFYNPYGVWRMEKLVGDRSE